jgi:hypothetical protein
MEPRGGGGGGGGGGEEEEQEEEEGEEILANIPDTIIRILLIAVAILMGRNIIQKIRLKGMSNINI